MTQQAPDDDELKTVKTIRFSGWSTPPSVEIKYVTDVIGNFTGREFLIAFALAAPPVFVSPSDIPDEMTGEVLFRCAISKERWAQAVDSFADQIEQLRKSGVIPPRARAGKQGTTSDEQ